MTAHRHACEYGNCVATAERDWLLAEASDEVRETFFAIRDIEAARVHAMEPIDKGANQQ